MPQPGRNGAEMRLREEAPAGSSAATWAAGSFAEHRGPDEVLHRVVAEEGGEEHRDRRQVRDPCGRRPTGTPCARRARGRGRRQGRGEPDDHQGEEDPDREHLRRVLEGGVHAAPAPRCWGGRLFITPARFGEANDPVAEPVQEQEQGEGRVGEVDGQELQSATKLTACDRASRRWRTAARRSGPRACPETGPATRKPKVSGSM